MTEGVSKAYVVDMVPKDKRGTAIGLYVYCYRASLLLFQV